jgi:hypothetical protein
MCKHGNQLSYLKTYILSRNPNIGVNLMTKCRRRQRLEKLTVIKVNYTRDIYRSQRIPKGQSKLDKPEKLATRRRKTQHNMCWTPQCVNK